MAVREGYLALVAVWVVVASAQRVFIVVVTPVSTLVVVDVRLSPSGVLVRPLFASLLAGVVSRRDAAADGRHALPLGRGGMVTWGVLAVNRPSLSLCVCVA